MSDQIRISAKNLGALAMPGFCPRCFWMDIQLKPPASPFPSIFSSIDSYTKKIVHGWFDVRKENPVWFSELGDVVSYKNPQHHTKFFRVDDETNIRLTGVIDDILVLADGSHLIVDYKTAKYTKNADALMPIYEVQLNTYAFISQTCGPNPLSGLALIYMEPVTDDAAAQSKMNLRDTGFAMEFQPRLHSVKMQTNIIKPLLRQVREIHDLPSAPVGATGCENCQYTNELAALVMAQHR